VKHERATEETRQKAALYALGLLTQHEAHCFELHLEECLVCRMEFGRLLLAVAQIGLAASEKEPPEDFRERLAAKIDSSPRPEFPSDPLKRKEPEPEKNLKPDKNPRFVKKTEPLKKPFPVQTKTTRPNARPRSRKTAFVINAVIYIILAALAAFAFYARQSAEKEKLDLQNLIESSSDDLADLRRQLEPLRENAVKLEKLEKFLELFNKPSLHIARLKGQPLTPSNTGAVFLDELTGDITIVGAFEPAPAGKIYKLWLSASSGRTFVVTLPSGRNSHIFTVVKFRQGIGAAPVASGMMAIVTLESESDLSTRTEPAEPWSAAGRFD